jgi:hypothetical protein
MIIEFMTIIAVSAFFSFTLYEITKIIHKDIQFLAEKIVEKLY